MCLFLPLLLLRPTPSTVTYPLTNSHCRPSAFLKGAVWAAKFDIGQSQPTARRKRPIRRLSTRLQREPASLSRTFHGPDLMSQQCMRYSLQPSHALSAQLLAGVKFVESFVRTALSPDGPHSEPHGRIASDHAERVPRVGTRGRCLGVRLRIPSPHPGLASSDCPPGRPALRMTAYTPTSRPPGCRAGCVTSPRGPCAPWSNVSMSSPA